MRKWPQETVCSNSSALASRIRSDISQQDEIRQSSAGGGGRQEEVRGRSKSEAGGGEPSMAEGVKGS